MVIRVPKFVFLNAQEWQQQIQSQHHNRPTHSGLKYLSILTVASLSTGVVSGAAATGTSTVSSSTLAFAPSARPQFRNADFSCNSSPYSSRPHACRFGASVKPRGGLSRADGSIVSSMTNPAVMSAGGMHCGPLLTAVGSVIGRRRRGQEDLRSSDSTDGVSVTQAKEAASGGGRGSRSPSGRLSWRRGEWCSTGSSSSALGSSGKGVNGDRTGSSRSYTPWGGGDSPLWVTGESVGSFGGATATVTATAAAVEEAATSRDKVWSSSEGAGAGGGRDTEMADVIVSDQDVVGDDGEGQKLGGITIGADLMGDLRKRSKLYASDWTDGLNSKSVPAILFLYFACLLPAVAFGGIASQVTQGTLGVIEYLASCGLGGMTYAMLSGQPMTFIGPTGLTLAFMTSLYSFTSLAGLPFLPVYAWVGMWTSCFLMTLSLVGASNLIRYATQFTDDVFNALLSVNFIYEAARSLLRNFSPAVAGYSQAGALMSLNVAVATYVGCRKTSAAQGSGIFNKKFREFVSDFGPLMVIVLMSCFCALPSCKGLLSFLEVPSALTLGHGRSLLVPIFSVRPAIRMASALPAMLLTSLFFLDQNISSRVVNSPRHKMVKGPAYHQDMLVLGMITGVLSIVGLPWQCAATVQSLNHVRQMATFRSSPLSESSGKSDEIESIYETRLTGFCVHALVLASLALLPQLSKIPMAVVSGIFLYLGRKVMSGNAFLIRVKEVVADRDLLSSNSDIRKVGFRTALKYTAVQTAMLALLWTLKSFGRTALFFPSVIGLLIIVRLFALPKMFTSQDLSKLDAAVG